MNKLFILFDLFISEKLAKNNNILLYKNYKSISSVLAGGMPNMLFHKILNMRERKEVLKRCNK